MTIDPSDVMHAGLRAMGACVVEDVGPGVAFAMFVDWKDGRPHSYLSNAARRSVAAALGEWLARAAPAGGGAGSPAPAPTPLQNKAATIVLSMSDEDVGAALFLFGGEPGRDGSAGETAYASSIPNVRQHVERFVMAERRRL